MTTLITGGTGSFGKAFLRTLSGPVRVMSRDEEKQRKMVLRYPDVEYVIGDVRDRDAVRSAMQGVDEVHLLNITVDPRYQGQGWGRVLLDALALWARAQRAQWLWLEVRTGNARAQQVYQRYGYRRVGERKNYYPAEGGREDAIVMSYKL